MVSVEELSVLRIGPLEGENRQWCTAWNHTGNLLASCGEDKVVRVWKRINGQFISHMFNVLGGGKWL